MYFPNLEWESVSIEALWTDSINYLKCDTDSCQIRQNDNAPIPDYLFGEIENLVKADLGLTLQIPGDQADDKVSTLRT